MTRRRPDAVGAALAGAVALAVYLRTLAPGLIAVVDTPMFQFIGRVLGVPHNPGYPLYVLLTHAFSYLPIGSLAYRINLFSAVCGAAAVALVFLLCRELGCGVVISLAAALALAFGHIFWSQSIIAEVYTLNAALLAAALLLLLVWRRRQQSGLFFAAVAIFAAGLGNHTTILAFAPGMAAYALMTNRRFILRPRTLLACVALIAAGLLQYGFIILRSRQPGAYLESRASTVPELLRVMSGAQFEDRLFAFDWRTVLFERIPWVVHRVLATELTVPGLLLAAAGSVWLLRRRLPDAVLLLTGCIGIVIFAANYNVVDTAVFLIPAVLVLCVCAAVGVERATRLAGGGRAVHAATLAALALPIWLVSSNFARTDRSHDREAARQLDALFDALPDRSALVHEDFIVDRLVMYKLLGEGGARGRRIESAAPREAGALRKLQEQGLTVFAFPRSARRLRHEGLGFAYAPLPVTRERLADLVAELPPGTVVALAVPARDAGLIAAPPGVTLGSIGGQDVVPGLSTDHLAAIGVRGSRTGALMRVDPSAARVSVRAGERLAGMAFTPASDIDVSSGSAEAVIRQGDRDVVRTEAGGAAAIWTAEGRLEHAFVLERDNGYRVPLKAGPLSVYPLRGLWRGQTLSAGAWIDVQQSVLTGSVMLRVPAGATAVLLCGDRFPLAPRAIDRSSSALTVDVAPLAADDPGVEAPARARFAGLPHVFKVQVTASASGSVLLGLGGVPVAAIARITQGAGGAAATAFGVDTVGLLRTPDRRSEVLLMARDDQAQLTGAGWSAVDTDAFTPYRWMTAAEARLLLPLGRAGPQRIRVQLLCNRDMGASVSLRLNDVRLPAQPVRRGWHAYEWSLEPGTLRQGTNDAAIVLDRSPERAIALADVRVIQPR